VSKTVWSNGDGDRGEAVRIIEIPAIYVCGSESSDPSLDFGAMVDREAVSTSERILRQTARRGASLLHKWVLVLESES